MSIFNCSRKTDKITENLTMSVKNFKEVILLVVSKSIWEYFASFLGLVFLRISEKMVSFLFKPLMAKSLVNYLRPVKFAFVGK